MTQGHPHPRSRRAAAPLVAVLAAVLTIFMLALGLSFQSRGVTASVHKAVWMDRCEELALEAVREALYRTRTAAREPGTEAFEALRDETAGREFAVSAGSLPQLEAELGPLPGYALDGAVAVKVLRRSLTALQDDQTVGYEALGVVRFTATVTGPEGSRATIVEEYGLRQNLTGPPRPFDLPTFLLLEPNTLLVRGAWKGDPNAAIQISVTRIRDYKEILPKIAQQYEDAAEELRRQVRKVKIGGGSKKRRAKAAATLLDELAVEMRQLVASWPAEDWEVVPFGDGSSGSPGRLHLFETPSLLYTVDPTVDLRALDLAGQVGPQAAPLETLDVATEAARVELATYLDALSKKKSLPPLPEFTAKNRAFLDGVPDLMTRMNQLLLTYQGFQRAVVEVSGDAWGWIASRLRRLAPEELRWKADWVFEGPGAAARAREFLATRPLPSGVLWVDDRASPLEVELDAVEARLVIATSGDLTVRRCRVVDPARHCVTVIAHGTLEVGGGAQVAALSASGNLRLPDGDMEGSVTTLRIPQGTAPSSILTARIRRMPAVQTGPNAESGLRPDPDPENVAVNLGAAPLYRRVTR